MTAEVAPTRARLGHLPALDGLRAVAVIAVFLFHAGVIDGGFIGVDVFFVVSGFLITALAITEIEQNGRLNLPAFWARRARRLLPAVFVLCAVVVAVSAALGGGAARRVGRDVVSTLTYVANWTQVGEGRDYFATYESQPLLEHAWSLAVEEQFYVVWPLVLVGLTWLFGRTSVRLAVGVVATVLAAGSVGLAWWLAAGDTQLNRLYYGTDTRAVGLALGAAAACVLARGERTGERRVGPLETGAAVAGAAVLLAMAVFVTGAEQWLYGPGFLVIALASMFVVTAASGEGPVRRALSGAPLVAIGRVSYGVYLWHWPVIVLLDHERTGLRGPALGLVWAGATALLTVASWFLVEQRSLPPTLAHPWRTVGYVAAAVLIGVSASATVSAERASRGEVAIPDAPPPDGPLVTVRTAPAAAPPATAAPIDAPGTDTPGTDTPGTDAPGTGPPASAPASTAPAATGPVATEPAATAPPATVAPVARPADRPLRVLILGDSVAVSLNPVPAGPLAVDGYGGVDVTNAGMIACPVLRAGRWKFDGVLHDDPEECERDDRFADVVAAAEPDVVFMLFGWPAIGDGRYLDDGSVIFPCEPAFDVAWADEYELLAERFSGVARVVVSTVPPPGGDFASQSAGSKCLNAELRQRDVNVFDFAEWICPGGDCTEFDALRPDAVHFDAADDIRLPVLSRLVAIALATAGYAPDG